MNMKEKENLKKNGGWLLLNVHWMVVLPHLQQKD